MKRFPSMMALVLPLCAGLISPLNAAHVEVLRQPRGWVLLVDGQPYVIKGISYQPDRVGEDPGAGSLRDWMILDDNQNGKIDSPYDAFVDANNNNTQDPNELTVGDFALMARMGANTIRLYHHPSDAPEVQAGYGTFFGTKVQYNHPPNKELLRDLYQTYGIRTAVGDLLGAYTIGSGAIFSSGTDYRNATQKQRMLASVRKMVEDFKDEEFLLMYILGNENFYNFTATNAGAFPVDFAKFVEEATQLIHELDPHHPVAIANADVQNIATLATHAPSLDIFGANVYRGSGFQNLFTQVETGINKPLLLTEYGNRPGRFEAGALDLRHQQVTHYTNWIEIANNTAGTVGRDNTIGGFAFTWLDGWWKAGTPSAHTANQIEEWHGIFGQGNGTRSPYMRQLRPVYSSYQYIWSVKGDINGDGRLTNIDLDAMSQLLQEVLGEGRPPTALEICRADFTNDDLITLDDLRPFQMALTNPIPEERVHTPCADPTIGRGITTDTPLTPKTGPRFNVRKFKNAINVNKEQLELDIEMNRDGHVLVELYSANGEKIGTPFNGAMKAGITPVRWQIVNSEGKAPAGGTYFLRFELDGQTEQKTKLVLTK